MGLKGRVAFILGIRADESLTRRRSCINKVHENYITKPAGSPSAHRVRLGKIIYDWREKDVMKWLHENEIRWCPIYDAQNLVGAGELRVSTPLHSEAVKRSMGKLHLRQVDPELYDGIIKLWPEMAIAERYTDDFDVNAIIAKFARDGFAGCKRFVDERYAEGSMAKARAMNRVRDFLRLTRQEGGRDAYPPELLMKILIGGAVDCIPIPLSKIEQERTRNKRKKYGYE